MKSNSSYEKVKRLVEETIDTFYSNPKNLKEIQKDFENRIRVNINDNGVIDVEIAMTKEELDIFK